MEPAVKLLTVDDAKDRLGGLDVRHLIFHDIDGFESRCVVRVGRAVRVRADRLDEWIEERTGARPFEYSREWRRKNARSAKNRATKAEA